MPTFIDLSGQQFGRLTVVGEAYRDRDGVHWKCRCVCGNLQDVRGYQLRSGRTKSCGCLSVLQLVGQKFGRLTVVGEAGRNKYSWVLWRCRCVCGNEATVSTARLRSGKTASCGCLAKEAQARTHLTHGHARKAKPSRTYKSWQDMKYRCTNPSSTIYTWYGRAGVTVCERWQTFENFLADLGSCPPDKSLGRILDMGNYEPGNAFWQTDAEQGLARRNKQALLKWQEVGAA
jgi:hypothetical protein